MYGSDGASFTDGNFEESLTFQMLYDDQNTHSNDKKFDSGKYSDKAMAFVKYMWENRPGFKEYLAKISGGEIAETLEDAIRIAERFKFKAKPREIADDPERLSRLYGVTICYKKESIPDLSPKDDGDGQTSQFELLSFQEGGIPISEAETRFVPQARVGEVRQKLETYGLGHIDLRSTEELEVLRMARILSQEQINETI